MLPRQTCFSSHLVALALSINLVGCGLPFSKLPNSSEKEPPEEVFRAESYPSDTPFKIATTSRRFGGASQTVIWHSDDGSWEAVNGTASSSVPSLSGNGKYLTFSTFNGPGVVRLDGSAPKFPLTENPSGAVSPFLSPAGDKFYFVSSDRTGVRGRIRGFGIWVLEANGVLDELMERGTNSTFLVGEYLIPAISPDGLKMVYHRRGVFNGDVTIEQATTEGLNPSILTRPRAGYKLMQFNYSHDQKKLALIECLGSDPVPTHCNIMLWDFQSGTMTPLTQSASAVSSPVFSLDDRKIFYLSGNTESDQKIMSMGVDGSNPVVFIDDIQGTETNGNVGGNTLSLSVE